MFPIMKFYVDRTLRVIPGLTAALALQFDSWDKLCIVVDMVRFNRGRPRTPVAEVAFRDAAGEHVEAFDKAYPDATMKPKHKFMFHTAMVLRTQGFDGQDSLPAH